MTSSKDNNDAYKEGEIKVNVSMTISDIFTRSYEIYRDNPVIVVPALVPFAWLFLGFMLIFASFAGLYGSMMVMGDPGFIDQMELATSAVGGLVIFFLGFMVLMILAEGVTIEMIREGFDGGVADLGRAWAAAKSRAGALLVASILYALIVAAGYVLFILPGLILTFLLYFVAQAVMLDDKGPVDALKASYNFVRENLVDSAVIVLVSMAIPSVLSMIPLVGFILALVSFPYVISLATLLYIDRR